MDIYPNKLQRKNISIIEIFFLFPTINDLSMNKIEKNLFRIVAGIHNNGSKSLNCTICEELTFSHFEVYLGLQLNHCKITIKYKEIWEKLSFNRFNTENYEKKWILHSFFFEFTQNTYNEATATIANKKNVLERAIFTPLSICSLINKTIKGVSDISLAIIADFYICNVVEWVYALSYLLLSHDIMIRMCCFFFDLDNRESEINRRGWNLKTKRMFST